MLELVFIIGMQQNTIKLLGSPQYSVTTNNIGMMLNYERSQIITTVQLTVTTYFRQNII